MIEKMSPQWTSSRHQFAWHRTLEIYAYPVIGRIPVANVKTTHILQILEPIWEKMNVSAVRLRGRLEKILSAAITSGIHPGPNPASWKSHLENILPKIKKNVVHYAAIPYESVPDLISRIRKSNSITALALEFTILNATRAQETILCQKNEIHDDLWTIPSHRMKARKEHQIPLTTRSVSIIETAKSMDPESPYIFSIKGKPLTHTSMIQFAKKHFDKNITVHGFRSSFRDWVSEETSHSSEVAEMALAHLISNKVEAA
jgi:integrase